MRVTRTPLALAVLLVAAACSADSDLAGPTQGASRDSGTWIGSGNYAAGDGGAGLIGSGNAVATEPTQGGIGQIGSGNSVAAGGGIGMIGSGNSIASDSTGAAERGGIGLLGSGN